MYLCVRVCGSFLAREDAPNSLTVDQSNYYVLNTEYSWRIIVQPGFRVQLTWTSFDVEQGYDFVSVSDPCTADGSYAWYVSLGSDSCSLLCFGIFQCQYLAVMLPMSSSILCMKNLEDSCLFITLKPLQRFYSRTQYTGTALPPVTTSSRNEILILFTSDVMELKAGFTVHYAAV